MVTYGVTQKDTNSPRSSKTMRKIEHEMITAIKEKRCWGNSNTEVVVNSSKYIENYKEEVLIFLHGNLIATIIPNSEVTISDCGYQTATTKSRLNAILWELAKARIYSKNSIWYLSTAKDGDRIMDEHTSITIPIN
jgi:hypothetical protein